jgi:hypothetical protein
MALVVKRKEKKRKTWSNTSHFSHGYEVNSQLLKLLYIHRKMSTRFSLTSEDFLEYWWTWPHVPDLTFGWIELWHGTKKWTAHVLETKHPNVKRVWNSEYFPANRPPATKWSINWWSGNCVLSQWTWKRSISGGYVCSQLWKLVSSR